MSNEILPLIIQVFKALFAAVCLYCSDLEDLRGRQVPLRTARLNCVCKHESRSGEGQKASIWRVEDEMQLSVGD